MAEHLAGAASGTDADIPVLEVETEMSFGAGPDPGAQDAKDLPYPGLRSFRPDEEEIFFGRESALDAMAERLGQTKFLAVLGPSGCGKSSLVKTGLYTTLRLGLLPNAGGRWRIAELCPGHRPIWNLARGLLKARSDKPDDWEPEAEAVDQIAEHLRRGPRSVAELAQDSMLEDGRNLLIVIDQFEELFRFGGYSGREEAEAFVALLLESARSDLPIHVIITMRSEYLGACSLIPGLAERVSDGMFLTPRMTRDECREAIEGPARVRGFDIEPKLVARILNDLQIFAPFDQSDGIDQAERLSLQADQLPLMQHLLNRMWRQARAEERPGRLVLTLRDYDAAGGLTGALDAHGAEVVAALQARAGPNIITTIERVFRAVVDGPNIAFAVRCPRSFQNLVEAAGGEDKRGEVQKVVEAFRGPDCNFLRTSELALTDDVIVDIGHESLIRRWSCLRDWFEAEMKAGDMWRSLSQRAALWEAKEGGLLRDLDLRRVTEWWKKQKPTPYLASRHGSDLAQVQAFVEEGEKAECKINRGKKRAFYIKLVVGFMAVVVIFAVKLLLIWNEDSKQRVRYANELATAYANESRALRNYLGNQYCRSAEAQDCIETRLRLFLRQYDSGPESTGELGRVANQPAGGIVK